MDPNETLRLLDEAIFDEDRKSIAEHTESLIQWLLRDGFNPLAGHEMDWRSSLSSSQLIQLLACLKRIAEMK